MNLQTTNRRKSVLVLPRWYPNKTDIQLGIFIQRQLILMQNDLDFQVVYAQGINELNTTYELISKRPAQGLTEHIVYFKNNAGPLRKIINFWRFKRAQQLGLKQLDKPVDLCHIHVPYRTALPALKLKRKKRIPFLITEHWSGHLNGLYQKKNSLDKLLYKKVLQKSAKISTVSQALHDAFKKNTGFDSVLIPNYIEASTHTSIQTKTDPIKLLYVGDFHDEIKNITGILYAYHLALKSNRNLHLTLVGGGPDEDKIKSLIQELRIPDELITLTGRKEHEFVLQSMTTCDIYVCNSRHETFGMTVAEALMAGKPVICTRCGGPEEFLNVNNSILIDPTPLNSNQADAAPLTEAIKVLSKSYSSYNSEEISQNILKKFGEKAVRSKWLEFYDI